MNVESADVRYAVICFEDVLAIRTVGEKHAKGLGGNAEQPILALLWYAWEKGNKKAPPKRVERVVLVQPKKSEKGTESGGCFSKLLRKNYKNFWTQFQERHRYKEVLVIVNPFGGKKQARRTFASVRHMFHAASVKVHILGMAHLSRMCPFSSTMPVFSLISSLSSSL